MYWVSELYVDTFKAWERAAGGREVRGDMPEDALAMLERSMGDALHRYYGVELKPFHFRLIGYSPEDFLRGLESLGFTHYIVLDRRNRLRKLVSSLIAHERRDRYHLPRTASAQLQRVRVNTRMIDIDYESKPLLRFLEDYDTQLDQLSALLAPKSPLRLTYEDDCRDDPGVGYRKVCEYIGMRPRRLAPSTSPTNPFPLREMVENFAELEAVLRGTAYAWMLDD